MSEWRLVQHHHKASRTHSIRHRALFADTELHVQGEVFRCHRYVLAQNSDFFLRLFAADSETEAAPSILSATDNAASPPSSTNNVEVQSPSTGAEVQTLISISTEAHDPVPCASAGLQSPPFASVEIKSTLSASADAQTPYSHHDASFEVQAKSSFASAEEQTRPFSANVELEAPLSCDSTEAQSSAVLARVTERSFLEGQGLTEARLTEACSEFQVHPLVLEQSKVETSTHVCKTDPAANTSEIELSVTPGERDSKQQTQATDKEQAESPISVKANDLTKEFASSDSEPVSSDSELLKNREYAVTNQGTQTHTLDYSSSINVEGQCRTSHNFDRDASETINPDSKDRTSQVGVKVGIADPNSENTRTQFDITEGKQATALSFNKNNSSIASLSSQSSFSTLSVDGDALTLSFNEDTRTYRGPETELLDQSGISVTPGSHTSPDHNRIVRLDFITPGAFRAILDALYLGNDPVTASNSVHLYKAARRLEITGLIQHCEFVISDLLHRHQLNASKILKDPEMSDSSGITQAALDVLLTDFGPDSSKAEWFLDLPAESLISVLNDQRLNVRSEDEVYRALTNWYEHDPWSRERFLEDALTQIRLVNLSRRTLVEEVLLQPLCFQKKDKDGGVGGRKKSRRGDVSLKELVQRALAYHLLPDRRHDELLSCAMFRPSQASERVLLVLGDQSDKLYGFSFARRAWFKLAPPPQALGLGVAACTHGDDLYVTGGDKATTKSWRYRASGNKWKRLKDLNTGRRSHCSVAVGNCIYVLGGKDDKLSIHKDTIDSVEVFDLEDKGQGWMKVSGGKLHVPVRSMAAAVVGDKIYIFGGRTNGFQKAVDVIQCFDTVSQQCSVVGKLPSESCLARPLVANKVIYILETNGEVLRFHPEKAETAANGFDPKTSAENGCHVQTQTTPKKSHAENASVLNYSSVLVAGPVTKAGQVHNLSWKWYGVARSHDGTLYVIGGETGLPANSSVPKLSVVIRSPEDDGVAFNGQARFVCPENMALCYVNCHMCIPKSFLVEKVV